MPRRAAAPKSKLDHLRALPWLVIAETGLVIGRHWSALSAKDRARLARLVRESRGGVGDLSLKQRVELRGLVGKLDLKGIGRELLPLARRGRSRRKRRRAHA